MSDTPRTPQQQPDEEPRAQSGQASPSVAPGTQVAGASDVTPEVLPLSIVEEYYKRPGRTVLASVFGFEPFDFWFGRFYVGFFGVVSMIGVILGVIFYFYNMLIVEGTTNILAARIDPPPIQAGLSFPGPGEPGFAWMIIMISATVAFVGWAMRQLDISRKLEIGYEVPMAFGAVVSSWITLQWLRPIAMGSWGDGFPLGITHHLDWVSNIGYQYYNFFYNPFHAVGITLLFAATLVLAMHGSAILSAARRPVTDRNVDAFWRQLFGYSIGEAGVHRVAFWVAASSVLFANVCIFLSGTVVQDWNAFYTFWDNMLIWSFSGAGLALIGLGLVFARRRREESVDPDELEQPGDGSLEGNIGRPFYLPPVFQRLVNKDGIQVFPTYLGVWGILSIVTGSLSALIILLDYLFQVGYNPILFLREFFNLALMPPGKEAGLGFAPWNEGGAYLAATFFLHISVLAWWARVYTRAKASGLGTHLAWGFAAALSLYFVIYLIRPIAMGRWSEAPGHGFREILDWTNNVSILHGNFYYNPFHMISIFFLLGSVVLLAMHGATIVATERYQAEKEVDEMRVEGTGTQRAQLLWRWIMGFNANSLTIHQWAWWFAALCGITGAIGLLLSGTLVWDWYAWAVDARIVAPWPEPDWTQYLPR